MKPSVVRDWEILTADQRKMAAEALMAFYARERGEEIGLIAAMEIVDSVMQSAGKLVYNKGVEETVDFLKEKLGGVLIDVEAVVKK